MSLLCYAIGTAIFLLALMCLWVQLPDVLPEPNPNRTLMLSPQVRSILLLHPTRLSLKSLAAKASSLCIDHFIFQKKKTICVIRFLAVPPRML